MLADATQCTRGLGECFALAGFQGIVIIGICFAAAVAMLILIVTVLRKRHELGPTERIEHVVFHEDPSTVALNRTEAARNVLEVRGRISPLDDEFDVWGMVDAIESRRRVIGSQRRLGRGDR